MNGAFQTSREIFDNPIWQNVVEFRLFFLIYGMAVFSEEGARVGTVQLKRGQWLRSIRNIQKDLEYIENRQVKSYSISVISRAIDKLEKDGRITTEPSELGTLFTVLNYEVYQGFSNYRNDNLEQRWNSVGTALEQSGNNNKKDNNAKKEKKEESKIHYADFVSMTSDEYQKLIDEHGEEFTKRCIDTLDNYKGAKGAKYKSDYRAILNWVVTRVKEDDRKATVTPIQRNYQQRQARPQMPVVKSDGAEKLMSEEEQSKLIELARRLRDGA